MDRRTSYSALPGEEATSAAEIVARLNEPPYVFRWLAVPVRGSRSRLREELGRVGREEVLEVETRILGAHSILVRVGGVRRGPR